MGTSHGKTSPLIDRVELIFLIMDVSCVTWNVEVLCDGAACDSAKFSHILLLCKKENK